METVEYDAKRRRYIIKDAAGKEVMTITAAKLKKNMGVASEEYAKAYYLANKNIDLQK